MSAAAPTDLPGPPALSQLEHPAVFLDLDGTLAAIEPRPEDVKPEPWRTSLLQRLQLRLDGRLAVISGRPLEEVDAILEGAVSAVAAVHGLVRRRADGVVIKAPPHPALAAARQELQAMAERRPGLKLEDKGLSLALHYRQAPELGGEVVSEGLSLSSRHGLKLQLGAMVAELCTPGFHKGSAVRAFMAEPPFRGGYPLFVGDDLTDEDGFKAAQELGGLGVLAGPRRPTSAQRQLAGVEQVRDWLQAGVLQGAAS